jgi:hypothetical protein
MGWVLGVVVGWGGKRKEPAAFLTRHPTIKTPTATEERHPITFARHVGRPPAAIDRAVYWK